MKERNDKSEYRKKILLIGDWLIDEHWLTGIHRSPTSSRVGQNHFRGLQSQKCAIQSFCGAGQTASVLVRSVDEDNNPICDIFGIGIWHESDTNYLESMLDQKEDNNITPHFLTHCMGQSKPDNACLFNLKTILNLNKYTQIGTTKVIRIYQHTGKKIDLIQRIDWEQELPEKYIEGWVNDGNKEILDNSLLDNELKKFSNNIDAIVVKDLCKGVVSRQLIKWMANKYPKAPWYISTKAWEPTNVNESDPKSKKKWKPEWIEELYNANIRLFLVPQIPSKLSVNKGKIGVWLTKSNMPSFEAINEMEGFVNLFAPFKRILLVVLPEDLSVLALEKITINEKNPKFNSTIQYDANTVKMPVGLPMASIFFSAVIQNILAEDSMHLDKLISSSLKFTIDWMSYESRRIQTPELWKPTEVPFFKKNEITTDYQFSTLISPYWEKEKEYWSQARELYGIIKKEVNGKTKCYFELWRGMTDVDGYICLTQSKRRVINKLNSELRSFKNKKEKQTKAYMLVADPGSGKTYLIQRIADVLGYRFIQFNISQMLSKTDILDCFDTIITTQFKQDKNVPIIVFFDEINAKIQNEHVFDMFLSPLEEGTFMRGGKIYPIKPFVWVFVGTEKPSQMYTEKERRTIKAVDFESRLDLPALFFKKNEDDSENVISRTERVYLGVSLLRSFYPDVQKVSAKVLRTFHSLPDLEIRDLKHFVKAFENIQYGKVISSNIPVDWIKIFLRGNFNIKDYDQWDEWPLIEII